jgi:hypothetical protein
MQKSTQNAQMSTNKPEGPSWLARPAVLTAAGAATVVVVTMAGATTPQQHAKVQPGAPDTEEPSDLLQATKPAPARRRKRSRGAREAW